jgi:luciferase family oxidoreductase group 1
LQQWVNGEPLSADHPFARITAHPRGPTRPELWILGSSDYGAQLAAHFGLPYAFAYFFSDGRGVEDALRLYRENYRPSERYPRPYATVCIWALAADTEAEARRLAMTREHWRAGFKQGIRAPLIAPEAAAMHDYSAPERDIIERLRRKAFVGTADQVAARLTDEAHRLALEELVIVTWTFDPAARAHSYELLARAFGLASQANIEASGPR